MHDTLLPVGALIEVNEAVVAIARQMGFRNQRYEYHIIFVRLWKEISPWDAGSQNQQDHHEVIMSGPRAAPHFPDKLIPREFAQQQLKIGKNGQFFQFCAAWFLGRRSMIDRVLRLNGF
ncbi:MAG: hypothetical protein VST66_08270 [Nitrospirota bacterium]|nr:hypothetical protein [Nitrospirota bacterium]